MKGGGEGGELQKFSPHNKMLKFSAADKKM